MNKLFHTQEENLNELFLHLNLYEQKNPDNPPEK